MCGSATCTSEGDCAGCHMIPKGSADVRTSAMSRGWQPSPRCRSACFISSPMRSTVDVVPSLRDARARHRFCCLGW